MLLATQSCAPDADPTTRELTTSSIDSAGIRVVQSVACNDSRRRITPLINNEEVRIGTTDGAVEYNFKDIAGAVTTYGDTVVVADGASRELRWYTPAGEYVRSIGGEGAGPGEFRRIDGVLRIADTLVVVDRSLDRLSYVALNGHLLRTSRPGFINEHHAPSPLQLWWEGAYLAMGERWHDEPPGVLESEAIIVLVDPAGGVDTVTSGPGSEHYWHLRDSGSLMRVPFPNGHRFSVAVLDSVIFSGNGSNYEIRGHDVSGRLRRIIRVKGTSSRSGEEDWQDARAEYIRAARNAQVKRWFEIEFDAAPRREVPAAYDRLMAGRDGSLWAREGGRLDGMRVWAGFDTAGSLRRCVSVPPNVEVLEIGTNSWLGVEVDALGVERVVRWSASGLPAEDASTF